MSKISLLGAERQAATSFALAYPNRRFIFVTDREIIDGWDLANVAIRRSDIDPALCAEGLALCPRWLALHYPLSSTLPILERAVPGCVLQVRARPDTDRWIIKGDLWHRPDSPIVGDAAEIADVVDAHGCGMIFQPWNPPLASYLVIGRRWNAANVGVGAVRLLAERFFRDDIVQASETIDKRDLIERSLACLAALDYVGLFAFNWIDTREGCLLSSFRPTPRAVCGILRRAGVTLLEEPSGVVVASAGARAISAIHYGPYTNLIS